LLASPLGSSGCWWLKRTGFTIVFVWVCIMTKTADTSLALPVNFAVSNFHGFLAL
jgi:hypothetical protein